MNKKSKTLMLKGVEYRQYKAMIVKYLKSALTLPKKGKVEPLLELFYHLNPINIITKNYLH